jgi:hypothetical protein
VEGRAILFVEVMVACGVIGVLAFLIGLIARAARRPQAVAGTAARATQAPQWPELILALLLLAAVGALVLWLVASSRPWVWGETLEDWQSDTRAIVFTAVMIGLGVLGLVASFIYTVAQSSRRQAPRPTVATHTATAAPVAVPSPSGIRLIGLLGLGVALLLLGWIGLSRADQHALMLQLIYPASLGVALVLLFDKATRAWGAKGRAETVREWLLCDLLVFLLCLGFLNLRGVEKPDAYAGIFWDLLNLALFFATFWLVDRKPARFRFLAAYGYLVILPVLLLIWRAVGGLAPETSWWGSIWPFFILAAGFFVIEIITLVSGSAERQIVPAVKDGLFVLLYAILLIAAASSAAAPT